MTDAERERIELWGKQIGTALWGTVMLWAFFRGIGWLAVVVKCGCS